jgi:hypothetical protein
MTNDSVLSSETIDDNRSKNTTKCNRNQVRCHSKFLLLPSVYLFSSVPTVDFDRDEVSIRLGDGPSKASTLERRPTDWRYQSGEDKWERARRIKEGYRREERQALQRALTDGDLSYAYKTKVLEYAC